jgi:hypothetical protein
MQGRDAEAVPWLAAQTRDAWPDRVVWRQGNVPHTRFYWLAVSEAEAVPGRVITASVKGQTIEIECEHECQIELLLSDELLDLDDLIRVTANGQAAFEGWAIRSIEAIRRSLESRADPRGIATAGVVMTLPFPAPRE